MNYIYLDEAEQRYDRPDEREEEGGSAPEPDQQDAPGDGEHCVQYSSISLLFLCCCGTDIDGNSELGAHLRRTFCYMIFLRHLIISKAVANSFFFNRKDLVSFIRA